VISNLYKKIILLIAAFMLGFSAVHAQQHTVSQTHPNIVVSIEPLYELVSSLSHGVVSPEVIYMNFSDIKQPLTDWQKDKLLSADIIIRVGKGFEPQLDTFLSRQDKPLQNKIITLSNYIPVLDKQKLDKETNQLDNQAVIYTDRQAHSDLRFWMDPRLLKMLTDFIAPRLVMMDPEHYEEYLDNEVILRAQLKKVENKMVSLFKQLSLEQKLILGQLNPYLKNRYLSFAEINRMENTRTLQAGVLSCLKNQSYATIPLNLEYTEKALNSLLYIIENCSRSTIVSR